MGFQGPRACVRFWMSVPPAKYSGTTDSQGILEVPVPPEATGAELYHDDLTLRVEFGPLDPIDTAGGVRQRLDWVGARTVEEFQSLAGLAATGETDEVTHARLEEAYRQTQQLPPRRDLPDPRLLAKHPGGSREPARVVDKKLLGPEPAWGPRSFVLAEIQPGLAGWVEGYHAVGDEFEVDVLGVDPATGSLVLAFPKRSPARGLIAEQRVSGRVVETSAASAFVELQDGSAVRVDEKGLRMGERIDLTVLHVSDLIFALGAPPEDVRILAERFAVGREVCGEVADRSRLRIDGLDAVLEGHGFDAGDEVRARVVELDLRRPRRARLAHLETLRPAEPRARAILDATVSQLPKALRVRCRRGARNSDHGSASGTMTVWFQAPDRVRIEEEKYLFVGAGSVLTQIHRETGQVYDRKAHGPQVGLLQTILLRPSELLRDRKPGLLRNGPVDVLIWGEWSRAIAGEYEVEYRLSIEGGRISRYEMTGAETIDYGFVSYDGQVDSEWLDWPACTGDEVFSAGLMPPTGGV